MLCGITQRYIFHCFVYLFPTPPTLTSDHFSPQHILRPTKNLLDFSLEMFPILILFWREENKKE